MRRSRSPDDRFPTRELAIAAAIPLKSLLFLIEQGLAPDPDDGPVGKGNHRSYDIVSLGKVALAGAIHRAGVELLIAARVARIATEKYDPISGMLPLNISYLLDGNNSSNDESLNAANWEDLSGEDEFLNLQKIISDGDTRKLKKPLKGDLIIDVVDNNRIIYHIVGRPSNFHQILKPGHSIFGRNVEKLPDNVQKNNVFRINNDTSVNNDISVKEKFIAMRKGFSSDRSSEYVESLRNLEMSLRLNVSLIIRNSIIRLLDYRKNHR